MKNINIELKASNSKLQQILVDNKEKLLGAIIGPSLEWINQFATMKEKMEKEMCKLQSILITATNVHLFHNMHLTA